MSWKAHAQYLFKKMCWQEVRRSLRRSSSADSLELKISFIFLYVVRNSWTYTKTTISLIGSLYFTECTDIEVYLREANHDEYLPLQGFIWNQHNDQLPVGLLAQLFERCTSIAEIMGSNPVQAWIFFRPYFHYCSSSVHYCEDRFHIHVFIRSSNMWLSYIHCRLCKSILYTKEGNTMWHIIIL